jgi:transformation/transcription domain-associated protein
MGMHLPTIIPLTPQMRLIQASPDGLSFQDIFEESCAAHGIAKDAHTMYYVERLKDTLLHAKQHHMGTREAAEIKALKSEISVEIGQRFVPDTILTHFMQRAYPDYAELFWIRKKFTYDMAGMCVCVGACAP